MNQTYTGDPIPQPSTLKMDFESFILPKEAVELSKQILDQNARVLEMNEKLIGFLTMVRCEIKKS